MTCFLAPSPMASMVITEPTPITMPSSVRMERSMLCAQGAHRALRGFEARGQLAHAAVLAPSSCMHRRDLLGDLRARVGHDQAVPDLDHAPGMLCHFRARG